MIIINAHLEKGRVYENYSEMFPKLYHTDFGGKNRRYRDIAIWVEDGSIHVQTDVKDMKRVQTEVRRWMKENKEANNERIAKAMEIIKAIREVEEAENESEVV